MPVETRVVTLECAGNGRYSLEPPVDAVVIRYVNRLSDLLFVMARLANHRGGVPDVEW